MKVVLARQVVDFVRRLPPEPRARLRLALHDLAQERGDIKALEPPLEGYCRLRVGGYRVVFAYAGAVASSPSSPSAAVSSTRLLVERLRDRLKSGPE